MNINIYKVLCIIIYCVFAGSLGDEVTQFTDFSALAGGSSTAKNKRKRSSKTNKNKSKKRRFH